MSSIKNRSEILFLYDVTYANPNGDPNDENKPRIDEETGINIVTDVRLKRTIRDYLYDYKKQEIFIRDTTTEDGTKRTKGDRLKDFAYKEILKKCIDLRLFGATIAVKDKRMSLTGPVQFKYGHSLHRVNLTFIKGTTVMPSEEGKEQGTFTERYILPYSLIAFYGVVNETAAITQGIPLTEDDVNLMMEAIWYGTKNLISGSKFGQMPRFLMQVIYKPGVSFYLGELDRKVKIQSEKKDEEIRSITEVKIDITKLVKDLLSCRDQIKEVRLKVDEQVSFISDGDGKDVQVSEMLKKLKPGSFNF